MNHQRFGYTWPGGPSLPLSSCGCNQFPAQPCGPVPFCPPGTCPIQLDTSCSIYHKNMNVLSGLVNLNLPNGSTLELILNTIDGQLGVLNVNLWPLSFLRSVPYVITNLAQFGSAVDTQFNLIAGQISTLQADVNVPNTATDTETVHFVLTGTLDRNISADVKVSATSGNQLTIQPDGLFSQAQNLSVDYTTGMLTITDGNTVDFTPFMGKGWKGNVTSDPASVDGDYWFRTDLSTASGLKIKLNGAVRTITTS